MLSTAGNNLLAIHKLFVNGIIDNTCPNFFFISNDIIFIMISQLVTLVNVALFV